MLALLASFVASGEEFGGTEDFDRGYLGVAGSLVLPQGGSRMPRLGGASLRGGWYLTTALALEGEIAWLENRAGLAAGALWHWHGWEEFDLLFGYERFDPFFTVGARGYLNDGQVGPYAGVGALYYLDDEWALRADAVVALGLDTRPETVYQLSVGVQYSF